jgi:hypothetical protein
MSFFLTALVGILTLLAKLCFISDLLQFVFKVHSQQKKYNKQQNQKRRTRLTKPNLTIQ